MTFATDELFSDLENMHPARPVTICAGESYFWHTTAGELMAWLAAYRERPTPTDPLEGSVD